MKTVLVDLLFYTGTRGGMESYVRQLYPEIAKLKSDWKFVALSSTSVPADSLAWFPGIVIRIPKDTRSASQWALAELFQVNKYAKEISADFIHSPANISPIWGTTPVVLTIQDLLSFEKPNYLNRLSGSFLRGLIALSAKHSQKILTISHASLGSIKSHLSGVDHKVTVAELAGGQSNKENPVLVPGSKPNVERIQILSGGNRLPHKNFETLIRGLALIPRDARPLLTITGGSNQDPLSAFVEELGLENDVRLVGWIPQEQIECLYSEASIYFFPTRFEGFGLPVLEAMARGCPVICSDIPVLREVGGEAAMYLDTTDPSAISSGIMELLNSEKRLQEMREIGLLHSSKFTWELTARKTIEVFESLPQHS